MTLRAILSEAWANLQSGTTRAALLALLFSGLVGTLAALDGRAVLDVVAQAERFRTAGAATYWLRTESGVDGRQCDALAGATPINQSGALRSGESLRALAMPDTAITPWEATTGLIGVLAVITAHETDGGDGVWVSADLAESLGLRTGSTLVTDRGNARVGGIYDWADDGRVRDLGFTMVIPVAADGQFDACWANIWPQDDDAAGLLYLAVSNPDIGSEQGQLNAALGARIDPTGLMANRLTRHSAVGTALIGAVLGWAAMRTRRLELASALHARVRKPQLMVQMLLETLGWLIPAALLSLAIAILPAAALLPAISGSVADAIELIHVIANLSGRVVLAGSCAALLATILAVAACREKHLFALFKNR